MFSRRDFLKISSSFAFFDPVLVSGSSVKTIKNKASQFGVNCFDLFYSYLLNPNQNRHPNARLRELRMHGIPLARFACSPIWPKEWTLYQRDSKKYFALLDEVVSAAEYQGVSLIPSLFWNAVTISDLVGEPISYWGKENSATREFMQRYTSEVIGRYEKSPAILMWEFGNEFNSYADLPNALKWWPRVDVNQGTPVARNDQDLIKATDCASAFAHFGRVAKSLDPSRLVGSGADIPNPRAMNLVRKKWDVDSSADFRTALGFLAPSPMDVLSIHLYPQREGSYFAGKPSQFHNILSEVTAVARVLRKRVFIGEFGVPQIKNVTQEKLTFVRMLDALVDARVDWAALWVYDLAHQEGEWSVRFDNERAWQLELIASANARLSA